MIPNNIMAISKSLSSFPYGSEASGITEYRLMAKGNFERTIVTSEYHYNPQTGISIPLWYIHYLRELYYNSDSIEKSIKRNIRNSYENSDRIISAMIPSASGYVILGGSVSVRRTRESVHVNLDPWEFAIDYGKGEVSVLRSKVQADDVLLVRYTLVPVDIQVETEDEGFYRIEVREVVTGYSTYYTTAVLTPIGSSVRVKYKAAISSQTVDEVTESTTPTPLFVQVEESVRADVVNRVRAGDPVDIVSTRVFSLSEVEGGADHIYITTNNKDSKFTFTSSSRYNNRIRLTRPESLGFMVDWYPRTTTGSVHTYDDRHFLVGDLGDPCPIVTTTEVARVVDPTTLSVSKGDLLAMYTSERGWYGVTVERKDGVILSVESLDTQNGLINLATEVSRLDIIKVTYQAYTEGHTVDRVCLNPLDTHAYHNKNIRKVMVLYVLGENRYSEDTPVYARTLEKYIEAKPVTYTYSEIDNLLNSSNKDTRNTYRSLIDELPDIYLDDDLIRLEPLALLYVINPLDEDGYLVEDARLSGGGTIVKHRSYFDYSYYDGEGTDMESYLSIKVPQYMYNDLKDRAIRWDPDVITSSDPSAEAHKKTIELIRRKVKKFSQLGTKQEITVG
jgi:hypothetical protein